MTPFRLTAAVAAFCLLPLGLHAAEVRPNVTFVGTQEPAGTPRAVMQDLLFDIASAWSNCDFDAMKAATAEGVDFSYPTSRVQGQEAILADLKAFCDNAKDTSIYFPKDAFYIDEAQGRIAAEVQFRTFQRGHRQVVNDVWVAHVDQGKVTVIKEYLDGRVKDLQAQGVLVLDESPEFMTPWPARSKEWEACFPIVKAAPVNTCP